MKYNLIGIRPNHAEMKKMVGTTLLALNKTQTMDVYDIAKCLIIGIKIGENDKWEFMFDNENYFEINEPLFVNVKSVRRYLKQRGYKLYGQE